MPDWTWIDEGREISEEQLDELKPTLDALAAEWTSTHSSAEQKMFRRMADDEWSGGDHSWGDCPVCEGCGPLGLERRRHRTTKVVCIACGKCPTRTPLVGIECFYCKGAGYDVRAEQEYARLQRAEDVAREVKLRIIESMLEHYGARMMRPYEHWNEEEHVVQYLETRYDTQYEFS